MKGVMATRVVFSRVRMGMGMRVGSEQGTKIWQSNMSNQES